MNILLVQTGFLGDVILSSAVISNLSAIYPSSSISVLTTPQSSDLLKYHPGVKDVIEFDKRGRDSGFSGVWNFARKLRNRRFDLVLSLHKSYRTSLLLFLSRIPKRVGFREASFSFLYHSLATRKDLTHEVLRNLAIFRALGIEPEDLSQELVLALPEESKRYAEKLLIPFTERKIIGIAPGSVWKTKRWSVSGFRDVCQHFLDQGIGIVVVGGQDDASYAESIVADLDGPVLNLCGTLSLTESAAVIARLDTLVSNDTAPLHMASALRTPVAAVFCATIPEFGFGPWRVPYRVIETKGLKCRPCGSHGGQVCPTGTEDCIKGIKSVEVIHAVESLLNCSENKEKRKML